MKISSFQSDRTFMDELLRLLQKEVEDHKNPKFDESIWALDSRIGMPPNGQEQWQRDIDLKYLKEFRARFQNQTPQIVSKENWMNFFSTARDTLTAWILEIQEGHRRTSIAETSTKKNIVSTYDKDIVSLHSSFQVGKEWPDVYVVGCFDKKKTFYAQQKKAFGLAAILKKIDRLQKGTKIAVVGGGIAGMTFGLAAAKLGCHVTVFEAGEELSPIQRGCSTRFIHPNILDWPNSTSHELKTSLPFLNWKADYATNVINQIEKDFRSHLNSPNSSGGTIELKLSSKIVSIHRQHSSAKGGTSLKLYGEGPQVNFAAHLVILAIGFGIETDVRDGLTKSYWHDDSLHQCIGFSDSNKQKVLVCGLGDGGLIDVMRASIKDFKHNSILDMFPELNESTFLEKLHETEKEASIKALTQPTESFEHYLALEKIFQTRPWVNRLRNAQFAAREVWIASRNPNFYSGGSSLLNRVIVHSLITGGVIKQILTANLKPVNLTQSTSKRAGFSVAMTANRSEFFDEVIFRHGSDHQHLIAAFPMLALELNKLQHLNETLPPNETLLEKAYLAVFGT